MGTAAAALSLLTVTAVCLGTLTGFGALIPYLTFAISSGAVLLAAWRAARWLSPRDSLSDALIRIGTLSFAIVVSGELLLGITGLIGPTGQLVLFGAICAASFRLRTAGRGVAFRPSRAALVLLAAIAPMIVLVVATGITQSPLTLYDSLSYHLVFPARWLLDHRLSIVPTPFSDAAQAYAPANGELFFLWLMTPFHGDVFARVGQLPFYLLGGVALYRLARQAGAPPAHAVYPPLLYFFARPIVEQAIGADVDLICWTMFLAALSFSVAAVASDRRDAWLLSGISLGLCCGSKYLALVYLPVAVAFACRGGLRRRMVWAVPGLVAFAAPWYIRNWIVGGSPIYPSSLSIAGLTIAQGAYSRQAMTHSVFHIVDARLLPVVVARAMGPNLALLWLPAALIGGWSMIAGPRSIGRWLAAAPVVMAALEWFGVPDNADARFLMPAAILAVLPFAFLFRASRVWNACMHVALAAGALWLLVGSNIVLPFAVPWFMDGWLSLQGIVGRDYAWWFIVMALAAMACALGLARRPIWTCATMAIACAAACVLFTAGSERWCLPDRCRFLTPSTIVLRGDMVVAWRWLAEHTSNATVAYTGNNVPYPLFGSHLSNRVYYVNIDRHREWRFHDYDRAHRRRLADEPPVTDPLAIPSGVLLPVDANGSSRIDAVRPRYERTQGLSGAWIDNLKARGATVLFASALSAYEVDYNWHDARGFPIEAAWARSNPRIFTPVYENAQVEIYAVHPP